MNSKMHQFFKNHTTIQRMAAFLLTGVLTASCISSALPVIAADDIDSTAVSESQQDMEYGDTSPVSSGPDSNLEGGGTTAGSSESIPDAIHVNSSNHSPENKLKLTDVDGKAEIIENGAGVLKNKHIQGGSGSSNSVKNGSIDNVTVPYESFNTNYGSITVEFCGSDPNADNYKTDPDAGWNTTDLSLDTTSMTFSVKYHEVGTYSGKKIGAVAEYKVTPYKNENGSSSADGTDYGNDIYYPIVQISSSLYSGWEWQNVKQFHVALTFYYLNDNGSFADEVLMEHSGTYESNSADYYVVNALSPAATDGTHTYGPEYVLPDDVQNMKAYCYDKDSYVSNITSSYTDTGCFSDTYNCSNPQYAYNGGTNSWTGEAEANGKTDRGEDCWQNSVMIMPQTNLSVLGMTFGNLIATSCEAGDNSKAEIVPHTSHMWASLSTESFHLSDVESDESVSEDNSAQGDTSALMTAPILSSPSILTTSSTDPVTPEKGDKSYLSHKKTIDYLGDNGNNPDTTVDDNSSSGDLEDLYRLYLDASGKQEPIDLLLIIDRSGSMQGNTINQNGTSVTRSQAIVNLMTGKNGQENFINKFLSLNSSNKIAITWFGGYWEKDWQGNTYTSFLFSKLTGNQEDAGVALPWTSASEASSIHITNGSGNGTGEIGGKESNGTDYTAGLWQAADTLQDPSVLSDNNPKVVVFLSDGIPTHYISTNSRYFDYPDTATYTDYKSGSTLYRLATGQETQLGEDTVKERAQKSSIDVIKSVRTIAGLQNTRFYSIAYNTTINDVLKTLSPSNGGQGYSASDTESLLAALNDILVAAKATNAVVSDTLSEYVDYYSQQPDLLITKTNNATHAKTVLYQKDAITDAGRSIIQSVSVQNNQVLLTYRPGFEMDNEYTYTISFNVKVTDKAYSDYKSNGYPSIGDSGTDYGANTTSSGKNGFISNADAAFSYTTGGVNYKSPYDKPVVQVSLHSFSILKKDDDGNKLSNVSFSLYQADTAWNKKNKEAYASGITDANGLLTFSSLRSGQYLLYETATKDEMVKPDKPWRITISSYEVIVTDSSGQPISKDTQSNVFVLVNSHKYFSFSILKIDKTDASKTLKDAAFSLFKDEYCTNVVSVYATADRAGTPITSFRTGNDGKVTVYGLRVGKYYLKELTAPSGYSLMDEVVPITVDANGKVSLPNGTDSSCIAVSADSLSVMVKDSVLYQLPSTGGIGTGVFTIGGTTLILLSVLLLLMNKGIRGDKNKMKISGGRRTH